MFYYYCNEVVVKLKLKKKNFYFNKYNMTSQFIAVSSVIVKIKKSINRILAGCGSCGGVARY